ncbi:MAG TPA: EamA family transporter [Candidatus Aminicenantes bacterium]|nr:EamA family transporter [Candidatus Aminicenantes bacterium]
MGKTTALLSALSWAIAVILFSHAGKQMRPVALNLFKTTITTLFLLVVMLIWGVSLLPSGLSLGDWGIVALTGFLGITVADSLFFVCLNLLGAGMAAIVDCLYSPMVLFFSWWMLSDAPGSTKITGAALVVVSVLVASIHPGVPGPGWRRFLAGVLAGAGAMALMALSIVLMKPILDRADFLWVTELRLVTALIFLLIQTALHRKRRMIVAEVLDRRSWRHAIPGALMGNVIAMTMWVAAFKFTDVASAAILNQTSTIFIVILAAAFLNERFTPRRLIATLLAFAGSILVITA